jgi:hypothetical protein
MFFLKGQRASLETVYALAKTRLPAEGPASAPVLRRAYLRTLSSIQPSVPIDLDAAAACLIDDAACEAKLLRLFSVDCPLNDLAQHEAIRSGVYSPETTRGELQAIRDVLSADPGADSGVWRWFQFVVHSVFCSHSDVASGGTTSGAVGVIWIKRPSGFEPTDLKELLLHEMTHTLMFLDEWRFGHYLDYPAIARRENYALSPILAKQRPLDKVVHALMVTAEVLSFRELHAGHPHGQRRHPDSDRLIRAAEQSIASVRGLPNVKQLLAERAFFLIEECARRIRSLKPTGAARRPAPVS